MEYTDQQRREFKSQYAACRRRQWVLSVPLALVFLWLFVAEYGRPLPLHIPALVLMGVIAFALIVAVLNWRCPACEGYLGKTPNPKVCDRCGIELHD